MKPIIAMLAEIEDDCTAKIKVSYINAIEKSLESGAEIVLEEYKV